MAIFRTRRSVGKSGIPIDDAMIAIMLFFIVLVAFFVIMTFWGFGQQGGLRFL